MKSLTLPLVAALLPIGATAALAAPQSFGVHAGVTEPTDVLAQSVGSGYHFGFSIGDQIAPHVAIGFDADYHTLAAKNAAAMLLGFIPTTTRESAEIYQGSLNAKILLAPTAASVVPYLKVGPTFDVVRADVALTVMGVSVNQTQETNTYGGFEEGAGLRLGRTGGVSVEVLFHQILSDPERADMVTVTLAGWGSNGP